MGEAEDLYRATVEARKRILGPDHPTTLTTACNLARLLLGNGELTEAESLLRESITGYENAYGPDHPHTLLTVDQLGAVLSAPGPTRRSCRSPPPCV